MTELCLLLSEEEIDNVVRKFHETLRLKVDTYTKKYNLNTQEVLHLRNGMQIVQEKRRDLINPIGIKSVARFVRSRLRLHSERPETIPAFYFENFLDGEHNIDLIEVFDQPEGIVMNLIQVKSKDYTAEEMSQNTEIHKRWVDDYAIDLNTYERSFEVEPEDSNWYKEFFADISHVEDLILDVITDEGSLTTEILFEKLGLKDKPNVERVWILSKYIDAIKSIFVHVEDLGLTEYQLLHIHAIIADLESKLNEVLTKKKNLKGIYEVHSICAVGDKQVSDVVIFKGKGGDRKAINLKN